MLDRSDTALAPLLLHSSIKFADAAYWPASAIIRLGMDALRDTQPETGDIMAEDQNTTAGMDASRHLNRARAALREAAEHLEDAVTASVHPSLSVASALLHVGAARKAILPHAIDCDGEEAKAHAA